jgi:hypothetical protein
MTHSNTVEISNYGFEKLRHHSNKEDDRCRPNHNYALITIVLVSYPQLVTVETSSG